MNVLGICTAKDLLADALKRAEAMAKNDAVDVMSLTEQLAQASRTLRAREALIADLKAGLATLGAGQ